MNRQIVRAVVSASLLNVAAFAWAAEPSTDPQSPTATTQTEGAVGMRVYVDPETGAMVDRPVTAEQQRSAASDAEQFRQDSTGLTAVRKSDGTVLLDLEGRFEVATQATVNTDGEVEYTCSESLHAKLGKHVHDASNTDASSSNLR